MKKKYQKWLGLAAVFALLLSAALSLTSSAFYYSGYVNSFLGITGESIEVSGDTNYYPSAYGPLNAENADRLIADERDHNIRAMYEGTVLLRNENSALPLAAGERSVTVFGNSVNDPIYKSNAGNASFNADRGGELYTALEAAGFQVNPTMRDAYANSGIVRTSVATRGGSTVGEAPASFYTDTLKSSYASQYNDVAIVLLTRYGGEGVDLDPLDADGVPMLSLHQEEADLLRMIHDSGKFGKTVVLINSPFAMDIEWIEYEEYGVDACLVFGAAGDYGFIALMDILTGAADVSGHLPDTWASSSLSAPAMQNFGDYKFTNLEKMYGDRYLVYAEGIYVGYKYYETRYQDQVLGINDANGPAGAFASDGGWDYAAEMAYPFGYGLSYAQFTQAVESILWDQSAHTVTAAVKVTNNGGFDGKSKALVQLYAQLPWEPGQAEKSAIQLIGFQKSSGLAAGESETVTITVDKYLLASYDVTAHNGEGGYILSDGDYYLAIGDDAHDALNNVLAAQGYAASNGMTADGDAAKAHKWNQGFDDEKYRTGANGVTVSNQFEDCDLNYWVPGAGVYLTRNDWAGTYPVSQTTVEATQEMMDILDGEWYEKPENAPSYASVAAKFGVDSGLNLALMKDVPLSDRETWEKFIYQLQPEDLPNATAESFQCPAVGDISPAFGVGDGCDSVGGSLPHTVEFNGEQVNPPTTRYCSKIILTATWNTGLYAERGRLMGEDGLWSGFMINYSLGANLHRTPFGGRNYEYMSECPIMSYLASIPETTAMEAAGSHMGAKHFCNNDQEFYRKGIAIFFNEQALREGNLRAFEGALRQGKAGGIMQSLARVGLKWVSASYTLNTKIVRNEWGWTGAIDTDAAPCFDEYKDGGYQFHAAEVLAAGTQEWCLDGVGGHGQWVLQKAKDTDDGHLLELLIEAAISWEYAISRSGITNGVSANAVIEHITPMWQTALTATIAVSSILTAACFVLLIMSKTKKTEHAGH